MRTYQFSFCSACNFNLKFEIEFFLLNIFFFNRTSHSNNSFVKEIIAISLNNLSYYWSKSSSGTIIKELNSKFTEAESSLSNILQTKKENVKKI